MILDAALAVLMEEGTNGFTLDAVSRQAGLSKAGVLHHFPHKEDLAAGVVLREVDRLTARIDELKALEPAGVPGRWIRGYIQASEEFIREMSGGCMARFYEMAWSMPEVLDRCRPRFEQFYVQIANDGLDPVDGAILAHATDGLMLDIAMNLTSIEEPRAQATIARLRQMSRGGKPLPKKGIRIA
jgi:AcrR family transcriptional regulator